MAEVRVGNDLPKVRPICRGVREGGVLYPLLFNLYSEAIFQEALEERNVGVKVNGVWVNNICYADDTVLIADNMEDLRDMLGTVGECSKNPEGLNINTKKAKFMIITRKPQEFQNSSLSHENQPIERVNKFKYLGTWLCENWKSDAGLKMPAVRSWNSKKCSPILISIRFDSWFENYICQMLCLDSVALWHRGMDSEVEHYEQAGSIRDVGL